MDALKAYLQTENGRQCSIKVGLFAFPMVLWLQAAWQFRRNREFVDSLKKPSWFIGRKPMPIIWFIVHAALGASSYLVYGSEGLCPCLAYYVAYLFAGVVTRQLLLVKRDLVAGSRGQTAAVAMLALFHHQVREPTARKMVLGVLLWNAYVLSVALGVARLNPSPAREGAKEK